MCVFVGRWGCMREVGWEACMGEDERDLMDRRRGWSVWERRGGEGRGYGRGGQTLLT